MILARSERTFPANFRGRRIMDRRSMMGLVAVGTAGLAGLGSSAIAQHPHHHDAEHGDCLKACLHAAEVCNETFHSIFAHLKDGHAEHAKVAELTIDCQEFCGLAARLLSRESTLVAQACLACAEACLACVKECREHDDPQLKECVEACSACEKACRVMADRARSAKAPA